MGKDKKAREEIRISTKKIDIFFFVSKAYAKGQ